MWLQYYIFPKQLKSLDIFSLVNTRYSTILLFFFWDKATSTRDKQSESDFFIIKISLVYANLQIFSC